MMVKLTIDLLFSNQIWIINDVCSSEHLGIYVISDEIWDKKKERLNLNGDEINVRTKDKDNYYKKCIERQKEVKHKGRKTEKTVRTGAQSLVRINIVFNFIFRICITLLLVLLFVYKTN